MKFSTTAAIASLAASVPLTFASNVNVKNNCAFPVYLQPFTNSGGSVGKTVQVPAKGSYAQAYQSSGSGIRMGTYSALSAPLTLEYTPSGNLVYYDLSNNAGNPFSTYRNELTTTNGCNTFNCAPNDASCYSNGKAVKVYACTSATSLTTTLCA